MPSSDPHLDRQLQEFLAASQAEREQGHTIANLRVEMHQFKIGLRTLEGTVLSQGGLLSHMRERQERMHERQDHQGAAIVIIKRRLRDGEDDDEMDTGQFDVAAVRHELEEQRRRRLDSERVKADDHTWWKRTLILWVVGALGALALITLSALVTLAVSGASSKAPSSLRP